MRTEIIKHGSSFNATRYYFDSGEEIPEHKHTENMEHNIIVLKGGIVLEHDNTKRDLYLAPAIIQFNGQKLHRIIAIEDNTQTLHVLINGGILSFPDDIISCDEIRRQAEEANKALIEQAIKLGIPHSQKSLSE